MAPWMAQEVQKNFFEGFSIFPDFFIKVENIWFYIFLFEDIIKENIGWLRRCKKIF